jgi:Putative porin
MKRSWCYALVMLLLSAAAMPGHADEAEELRKLRDTTIALVNALVEQGVLTRQKADQLIAQAEQAGAKGATGGATAQTPAPGAAAAAGTVAPGGAATPPVAPGVVRVPYIPESVKEEIGNEVKQDVLAQAKTERWGEPGAFPDWLNHFTWYGDFRFRAEADRFPTDSQPNAPVEVLQAYGVNIDNSTEADNRLRVRARFGFDATVGDTVTVGMRLATGGVGSGSNPGSENQTLGNYETRSTVGFDRAYMAYHPESWVTLSLGRVGNPFFRPTTLVWADAVSLEGVVLDFRPKITSDLTFFTTAGALPILQIDPIPTNSADSKWLYAYQSGFELKFSDAALLKTGVALYDYRHIEGTPNPTIYSTAYSDSAAPYRQTGNTVFDINGLLNTLNGTQNYLWGLASKFHELNVSTELDLGFVGPTHIIIDGDWVKNLGFDESEIERRTGYQVDKQVRGWQTRLAVGYPDMHQKYSWQGYVGYRWVQRDATLDAFTDQDFHLGGTDAQGYYLGGKFAFEKNTYLDLRWFSAKQIDGVELAGADSSLSGLPLAIDVFQLDINSSF